MTHEEAITELVRIWHSPHLDLSLKTGLAEAIETLKEKNRSDSLVRGEVGVCKESESKLDLISRQDAISEIDAWIQLATDNEADMAIKEFLSFLKERIESLPSAEAAIGDYPNDLISRSALMEYCSNQKSKSIDNNDIARFPSAEAEVYEDYEHATLVDIKAPLRESAEAIHGEWIEVEVFPEVYDIEGVKTWGSEMQCDQCGFRHTAIEGHMAQYNFCPNCGARMLGEDGEA